MPPQFTQKNTPDIVVFSHLRWEFVWQRPQHIIQRLSKNRNILIVEEPIPFHKRDEGKAKITQVDTNITVLQPQARWENFSDVVTPFVQQYVKEKGSSQPILWFYSPMFVEVSETIPHQLIVFDCMDELSAFNGAPQSLIDKEAQLLEMADVVFTGGKSLFDSKKQKAKKVFCFPSSVDQQHFEKALKVFTPVPGDLKQVPHPIIGFYGVIDERMDLALLEKVASTLPLLSFVLVGPIVKIDPETLPKQSNIYYLGQRSYEELPQYLKAFDVAMMPFALNKSTQFISPTKTLEFMAAMKPIVSTPIYDVVRDYQQEVAIADDEKKFAQAIQNYIHESPRERIQREKLQQQVIKRTSWDKTVHQMEKILLDQLGTKKAEESKKFDFRFTEFSLSSI